MTSVSGAVKTINLPPSAGPSASSGSLAEGKFIFDWCENISGLPGRVKQFVKGFETERPARWETSLNVRSPARDRKSTRLNSSHQLISYAVFCLKKKKKKK